ncbi:MAG: FtsQ-type POTRA domain-containing protein [Alkalibacterium sp.]|nr:FtsQ-type POTRA domain-containing protein [Alkalibacterium sp.]
MTLKEENKGAQNDGRKNTSSFSRLPDAKMIYIKWSMLVSIFVLSILLSAYTISPYSKVNDVSVEGTNEVYDQEVFESSMITSGDSLFTLFRNRGDIEKRIEESIPQISNAKLGLTGLQTVQITVGEYQTVAYLLNEERYFKILENGVILDESLPRITSNQPVLTHFSQGPILDRMLDEYEEVEDSIKSIVSEIELMDNDRNEMLVRVFMNDGNEVLASIPSLAERLNYYIQMRETVGNEQGLFDLEAGAYFIPFNSEEYDEFQDAEETEEAEE